MNRKELVDALNTVKPAIASGAVSIESFGYFFFEEGKVTAWNDRIGITVPFDGYGEGESPIDGAVEAVNLLGFLTRHDAKTVNLQMLSDGEIQFDCKKGRSKIVCKYMEPDDFIFEPATLESDNVVTIDIDPELLLGMELCLLCSAKVEASAYVMGVNFDNKAGEMWSTDMNKMAKYPLSTKLATDNFILSADFCETLILLQQKYKAKSTLSIDVEEGMACATIGECRLIGKLIADDEEPLTFSGILEDTVGKDYSDLFVKTPKGFHESIDRQVFIASNSKHTHGTTLTIASGKMHLFTDTGIERGDEDLKVHKDHPDVELVIQAEYILPGTLHCDEFFVDGTVLAMRGENGYEYVTSHSNT